MRYIVLLLLFCSIPLFAEHGVHGYDDRIIIHNPTEDTRTEDLLVGQIIVSKGDNKVGTCSATLIGPNLLLTAAHCFHNSEENTVYANITSFSLQVSGQTRVYSPIKAKKLLLPSIYFEHVNSDLAPGKITTEQIQYDFSDRHGYL